MNRLGDYLSRKAPSTLVKRANSMVFLCTTLQQLVFFWPVDESDMYRIIMTLHSSGNSTSRLKSILGAITFCRYSFDIEDLHPITVSKRCLGVTGGSYLISKNLYVITANKRWMRATGGDVSKKLNLILS